jgi:hypothetical protein
MVDLACTFTDPSRMYARWRPPVPNGGASSGFIYHRSVSTQWVGVQVSSNSEVERVALDWIGRKFP